MIHIKLQRVTKNNLKTGAGSEFFLLHKTLNERMLIQPVHNSVLKSCTYILYDKEYSDVYLVDCGDIEPVVDFVNSYEKSLRAVFLTHCHYDHTYGLPTLIKEFPATIIYASENTVTGLKDARVNMSKYHERPFVIDISDNMTVVNEQTCLSVLGEKINFIETPGHDVGCLSYQIGNSLFTGDSYIPFAPVFYKWQRSDKQQALENEKKLMRLAVEMNLDVYPGHYQ